ncbi:MAG: hypothetical protein KGJ60_10880 [Verrucomicrobiota bacterium]|nr:hypothetical protein [Verrucomicrobiota bacterium]
MNPPEILNALSALTSGERVDFLPPAPEMRPLSPYAPIQKYLLDLKNGAKPESAAEDLFTALCKDVLGFEPTRQVGVREGFVDFMLPEPMGDPLPLELKPLFQYDQSADRVWHNDANPKQHLNQVKKYLRDHEYLILTDLRTAWLFCARDFFFDDKPFAALPFADFLARCRETRSVLDTLRRMEDTAERPELEQQFFEDLKVWFQEFGKIEWSPPDQAAESIILLINKLIFARTLEDFGLVPYRYTQDAYSRHTRDWQAKGAHRIVPKFLDQFEEFFDEYYNTEIFSARVWERLDKNPANLQRFCDKLNFVLGINTWDQTFSARGIVHYNYRRIDEEVFGKSYEMFLAASRKDEGIYYTPAGITGPMAEALVHSLAVRFVDEICDAVGSQKCDFPRAERLMARFLEIRVADTTCGSGGFLIKVLRAFWRQYQRIDAASAWVQKILKPDNGELYLAELPPNVEAALAFRRRWNFDNKRKLIAFVAEHHINTAISNPIARSVATLMFCRAIIPLCAGDVHFQKLTGSTCAFPDFGRILGAATPILFSGNRSRYQPMRTCQR